MEVSYLTLDTAFFELCKFAKNEGFAIHKDTTRYNNQNELVGQVVKCTCLGKPEKLKGGIDRKTATQRADCKWHLTIHRQDDLMWKIGDLKNLTHTHNLLPPELIKTVAHLYRMTWQII